MKKFSSPLDHHALICKMAFWDHEVQHLYQCMIATMMFGIGFAPIVALALALMEITTLPIATIFLVIPALAIAIGLSYCHSRCGRLMRHSYWMGIMAVAAYDCVRIPLIMTGWMNDFIPQIGIMLVGNNNYHPAVGYLWRYLGNGGGMGMAFVSAFCLLRNHFLILGLLGEVKSAFVFGLFVWACLIATIKISPHGEDIMFEVAPVGLLLSLIGHLVFGGALGYLVKHFRPEVTHVTQSNL